MILSPRKFHFWLLMVLFFVFGISILGQSWYGLESDGFSSNLYLRDGFLIASSLNFMVFVLSGLALAGVDFKLNREFFHKDWKNIVCLALTVVVELFLYFMVFALSVEFTQRAETQILASPNEPSGFLLRFVGGAGGLINSLILGFILLLTWPFGKKGKRREQNAQ